MKIKKNFGNTPFGALSETQGYATETNNFGEVAFGILNKSTIDEDNFTSPDVVKSSKATLFSVGNGSNGVRKNIIELKADGTVYISGIGSYDGTTTDGASTIQDTIQETNDQVQNLTEELEKVNTSIDSINIEKSQDSDLVYTLRVDGEDRGTINIPKDQFLKSVTYNEDSNELIFTFVTSESDNQEVRVNMTDLVDTYTAGDGLNLEEGQFSVKVDADTQSYIEVTANGVKIVGINEALEDYLPLSGGTMTGSITAINDDGFQQLLDKTHWESDTNNVVKALNILSPDKSKLCGTIFYYNKTRNEDNDQIGENSICLSANTRWLGSHNIYDDIKGDYLFKITAQNGVYYDTYKLATEDQIQSKVDNSKWDSLPDHILFAIANEGVNYTDSSVSWDHSYVAKTADGSYDTAGRSTTKTINAATSTTAGVMEAKYYSLCDALGRFAISSGSNRGIISGITITPSSNNVSLKYSRLYFSDNTYGSFTDTIGIKKINAATTSNAGVMSASDKTKLDSINLSGIQVVTTLPDTPDENTMYIVIPA